MPLYAPLSVWCTWLSNYRRLMADRSRRKTQEKTGSQPMKKPGQALPTLLPA